MTPDLARCRAEQARCAAELARSGDISAGGVLLGLADWVAEECFILLEGKMTEETTKVSEAKGPWLLTQGGTIYVLNEKGRNDISLVVSADWSKYSLAQHSAIAADILPPSAGTR